MKKAQPAGLLPSLEDLPFVCPGCRGELLVFDWGYRCPHGCRRDFRLHAGIPDFRIFPDPYLDFDADRERTDRVLENLDTLDFPRLLERYWSWSGETPEPLRATFVANALRGEERAKRILDLAEREGLRDAGSATVLDIGSGTGNLLAAAQGRFGRTVGLDIAMRWLHLSRRRFRDRGLPEPALVCACAETPPFPTGFFDAAFSLGTFEFARIQAILLGQTERILKPGGLFILNTVNRYSVAPEPHVDLLGVGYLPRKWQRRYVRWRRGAKFENIWLVSRRELITMAGRNFPSVSARLPKLTAESVADLPPLRRAAAKVFSIGSRLPLVREALQWIGPEWDVVLRKASSGG
ncbi:MAG TPA: class I SAM-dependent methyltransferase [Thermoanaerobaculia bacterium]|nr:class I SAM-dependent methyltransferase [Thermoanaerobaculia bacterium]